MSKRNNNVNTNTTLSSRQEKILTAIGIAVIAAVLIATAILVGNALFKKEKEQPQALSELKQLLVENDWYNENGLGCWQFSEGHFITLLARETLNDPFETKARICYALNDRYNLIMISDNEQMIDSTNYYLSAKEGYLYFYKMSDVSPDEDVVPVMTFVRADIFNATKPEAAD